MVHATANLVSPVAQTCSMHKRHSKKRVLQIFFSVSFVLFLFAITGNMNSDSTQNLIFPCGKCFSPVTDDHQGLQCDTCNIWLHAPCQRVGNMLYETQIVHGIALNVIP